MNSLILNKHAKSMPFLVNRLFFFPYEDSFCNKFFSLNFITFFKKKRISFYKIGTVLWATYFIDKFQAILSGCVR